MSTQLVTIESAPPPLSGRERMLERRKHFLGGSDCASLFNDEKGYGCSRRLAYDKLNIPRDYPRTKEELETLERGLELEDYIVYRFQNMTGMKVRQLSDPRVSKIAPHMGVNIDRQIVGALTPQVIAHFQEAGLPVPSGPGVLECKSANEFVFPTVERAGVSGDYIFQMQQSLAVTNYEWGAFAVHGFGARLWRTIWFPVLRDEALIQEILLRGELFWANHIATGELPAPLENPDKRCKGCQWRKTCMGDRVLAIEPEDKDIPEDESLALLANDYRDMRVIVEKDKEALDAIAEQIKMHIGNANGAIVPSAGIGFRFKHSKAAVKWDSKALDATLSVLRKKFPPENLLFGSIVTEIANCKRLGTAPRPFVPFEL